MIVSYKKFGGGGSLYTTSQPERGMLSTRDSILCKCCRLDGDGYLNSVSHDAYGL